MSHDPTDDSTEQWSDWPVCPQCHLKRQALCPICKSAGTHFELADFIPATQVQQIGASESAEPVYDDSTVLLMCDACDEAFTPKFYARCHTCGHEFPDGLRLENTRPSELSGRVLIVLFGIAALLFVLFVFFAWTLK